MHRALFGQIITLIAISFSLAPPINAAAKKSPILVHCAAGMRKPIETCAKKFQDSLGIPVQLSYDGSNRLLSQIKLTRQGDVYITGDAEYADSAIAAGLASRSDTLCWFVPVLMTKKGNPLALATLNDLCRAGTRIGLGDPLAAAVGKLTRKMLQSNHVDTATFYRNVVVYTPTVNDLANAIKLGTVDAVIVWSSIAKDYLAVADTVSIAHAPRASVGAMVLSTPVPKKSAQAFVAFLTGPAGKNILRSSGYIIDMKEPPNAP